MSPYERQIEPLEAVDVNYVLGVPGQSTSSPDESTGEALPTATALLAAAGIEIGVPSIDRLGYDSSLGYDTGSYLVQREAALRYAAAERDTELVALLADSGNHSSLVPAPAAGLHPRLGLGLAAGALALCLVPLLNLAAALLAVGALVLGVVALRRTTDLHDADARLAVVTVALAVCAALGSAVSIAAYGDADGPSAGQLALANGAATGQVLADDLGVGLGAWAPGGLPVTLTNTAQETLAYNVSVEALDAAGGRITADVAFVGALEPGQSTVVTMFAQATGDLAAELAGAQFHIVEASAY